MSINALTDAVFVVVIAYCLVATLGDVHRITKRVQKGWSQFRVTSRGRDHTLAGLVFGGFLLFVGRGHVRTIYQTLGWSIGAPLGLAFALSTTAKWKHELQQQQCSPLEIRRRTAATSTLIFLIFVLIVVFVLGPLLPDRFPSWLTVSCMLMGGGLASFLIVSGIYTWAWGIIQERAGLKPFEVRVRSCG